MLKFSTGMYTTKLRFGINKFQNICNNIHLQHKPIGVYRPITTSKSTFSNSIVTDKMSRWKSPHFWGRAGALAGWGMTGAAIYDANTNGPEIISINMTGVLILYSGLFARWAYVINPQNLALCACHLSNIIAQCNQMKRAIEYKIQNGEKDEMINTIKKTGGIVGIIGIAGISGPKLKLLIQNNIPTSSRVKQFVVGESGPFTVHFWAPMSKWLISGASILDLNRPTDKISIPQYSALALTGLFFSRYALLIKPINYSLCSVNIALFTSSFYHLVRKLHADNVSKTPDPASTIADPIDNTSASDP